jgi:hypothetical protein
MGKTTRKTLQFVKNFLFERGFKLLSDRYETAHQRLEIECPKGHIFYDTWNHIHNESRWKGCPYCNKTARYSYERAKEVFERYGFKLLSTSYKRSRNHLLYECPKGHVCKTSFASFILHKSCSECSGVKKHSLELVKERFEERGYTLLSTEYKNGKAPLEIICPNGHQTTISYVKFHLAGHNCKQCAKNKKKTKEEITEYVESFGYKIDLSQHQNSLTLTTLVCTNGHAYEGNFERFHSGNRCPFCYKGRVSKNSQEWLDYLQVKDREVSIKANNHSYKVDGFDSKTNTIYEFLGDYWHGNPKKYSSEDKNPTTNKTYGEMYNNTIKRMKLLKNMGYNVKYIWESEWNVWTKNKNQELVIHEYI